MDVPVESLICLNIGCGNKKIPGWLGIDLAGEPDLQADVRKLPLPDEYADQAMAIHVLEHIQRWEAPAVLREWWRVLKPGGLLVLELPDLIKCCRNVLTDGNPRNGLLGLYGDPLAGTELMMHKWGWQVSELKSELRAAGFRRLRERDPQFHGHRTYRDMRLEATK